MAVGVFTFDLTITLGQVVEAVGIIGTLLFGGAKLAQKGLSAFETLTTRVNSIDEKAERTDKRLDGIDGEMKKQTEILVALGEQGARIASLEGTVKIIQAKLIDA